MAAGDTPGRLRPTQAVRIAGGKLDVNVCGQDTPLQVEVVNPTDISTPVVNAIGAQTASLTAQLQAICDKLDAGITVNAVQSGAWSMTIDGQPIQTSLDADTIADLVSALEAAQLNVNIAGQDQNIGVTVDTTDGPIDVAVDFTDLINAIQLQVKKDYEPLQTKCIVDANGDEIPNTGVYLEYTYDFFGNPVGNPREVYSHIVNGEWTTYTLQAGDVVARCAPDLVREPKKQCWEVPAQVLMGTDAAPFVIVAGDLEIVSQGGQGNSLGPFVNTAGGLEFSIDGTAFDTWGNTVGGNGNQAVIDQDPLYIRNPATGTTVPFDVTALTGGGSPTYAATVTVPAQRFDVVVYSDGQQTVCDSMGNEVSLPAGAVQIECPSEFDKLCEIRDLTQAIKFGGVTTCFEKPNDLGQNTAPNSFEDFTGTAVNISADIELDIPTDGVITGFRLTLNSLTPAVPAPPTDTVISLLVNGVSTNTISTLGGIFTHEFTLNAPLPVSSGDFLTIQVVPEPGGIPADIFYLPANETQNAFLVGSNTRPMLTVIAEGVQKFSKVTYADKTEQFFDGEGSCIDALPSGVAPCENQEAQKLDDICDKLNQLIQIQQDRIDHELGNSLCYDVVIDPVELTFNSTDGENLGGGVINYADLNGTGIGATVTSSTGSIVLQSIGPLLNFNGDGTVTLQFSEAITIGEMTVRSSGGLDAVYSNFSVSPVSASAGFSLNGGVVTVDAGQAVPVDGIIDFGGVEVTEISFDINQNASTTHINNIAGVNRRPEVRKAVPLYEDGVIIEYRDSITQSVIPAADVYECPASSSEASIASDTLCNGDTGLKVETVNATFDYWELDSVDNQLIDQQWDDVTDGAGIFTLAERIKENGDAFLASFDTSQATSIDGFVSSLNVDDANNAGGVVDYQRLSGYIVVTEDGSHRYAGAAEGYIALDLMAGSLPVNRIYCEVRANSGASDTFAIASGIYKIYAHNVDLGGISSSAIFQSDDGTGAFTNGLGAIMLSSTKPTYTKKIGNICAGVRTGEDGSPIEVDGVLITTDNPNTIPVAGEVSITPECKQELAKAIAEENAKCVTAQFSEKQLTNLNSLVDLFNFAPNADDTIDNAVVTIADIEAFFDNFDYDATPAATSTQGNFSIADFVGGAGTESNASFIEGYINVTGPMFIRMQNTNNWSGRVDLGENCSEYEDILTHYNGPGQSATSPAAAIPLGMHSLRVSSWDYDGANGNVNVQFSVTGTNGWTTDAASISGLEFGNVPPTERTFLGRVCEGSQDVIEVSTGLVVPAAELASNETASIGPIAVGPIFVNHFAYHIADPNDPTKKLKAFKMYRSDGTLGERILLTDIDPDAVDAQSMQVFNLAGESQGFLT